MKDFKLSMFQLMTDTRCENVLKHNVKIIKVHENKLYKNKTKNRKYVKTIRMGEVKLHPPGKLQYTISDIEKFVIGSIELKLVINESTQISLLMFKHKMKMSGGFVKEFFIDKLPTDIDFRDYIMELNSIISYLFKIELKEEHHVCLINSMLKMNLYIPEFIKFCKNHFERNELYNRVVMPFTSERGRMCAIKVYPNESNESVHFDHKGNLQFFGFKSITKLI
jgi:hypothetical protein